MAGYFFFSFFSFNDMIAQLSNPIMKLFILDSEHFFILICHFSWVERDAEEKYLENCSVRAHDAVSHEH